ncbi:MAG TPA: hypothetical protein DCX18_02570 [Erysipelotrichaceae bacterium]|nr:hypothetical protein [Erysipelotrichaceae bacterium]
MTIINSDLSLIIRSNKQRWEIEESFQIMKSELKTRPMYVSREDSINGRLLPCFMVLMVYHLLEKKYLNEKYTCDEVFNTLRDLNITPEWNELHYIIYPDGSYYCAGRNIRLPAIMGDHYTEISEKDFSRSLTQRKVRK